MADFGHGDPTPGSLVIEESSCEIDTVSATESDLTLDQVAGFPEGTLRFGGAPWRVAKEGSKYVLQSVVTAARKESWLEFDAQGPCRLRIAGAELMISVDGSPMWHTGYDGGYPVVEIPSGTHQVRARLRLGSPAHMYPYRYTSIHAIVFEPISENQMAGKALDFPAPWMINREWETRTLEGSENGTVFGCLSTSASPALATSVTGPGYVSFRSSLEPLEAGQSPATIGISLSSGGSASRSSKDGSGWKEISLDSTYPYAPLWVPPGKHRLMFRVGTVGSALLGVNVDRVGFTPSPVLSLGEGAGAPVLNWNGHMARKAHGGDMKGRMTASAP